MENPHAFRKHWPKKKARANRRSRLKLDALLRAEGDFTPSMAKAAIGAKAVRKGGVKKLRDFIALKKSIRERLANRRARAVRFRVEGQSAVSTAYVS